MMFMMLTPATISDIEVDAKRKIVIKFRMLFIQFTSDEGTDA